MSNVQARARRMEERKILRAHVQGTKRRSYFGTAIDHDHVTRNCEKNGWYK